MVNYYKLFFLFALACAQSQTCWSQNLSLMPKPAGYSMAQAHMTDQVNSGAGSASTTKSAAPKQIPQPATNAKNGVSPPEGNGKAGNADAALLERGKIAFQSSCTECHEASRSMEQSKSYAQWMETIRKMAAKEDAQIRPADFDAIARYLTATAKGSGANGSVSDKDDQAKKDADKDADKKFDPAVVAAGRAAFNSSCLKCHDAERSTSKSKSYSEWLSTVRRMASKDGAAVSPSDYVSIATYLASLSGGASGEGSGESSGSGGGWSFGTTVSTIHRSASDESLVENPGFFADVWVTTSFQSAGPWSATVTACTSCHSTNSAISSYSLELLEGSATVDLRKLFTECQNDCGPQVSLKAGRFPVPFGAFSSMSHPGVYRAVTVPLMFNMGRRVFARGAAPPRQPVLPLPFPDEGIDFMYRQKLTKDISFGLDLYAVNGLQGNENNLFELSRAYSDNNEEPSIGLRTTLGGEFLTFGASLLHGGLQDQRRPLEDYTLWGADVTAQLTDRWRVYAEYARRRQDSNNFPGTAEETSGVVAETEFRFWTKPHLSMLVRYDTLDHRSENVGDASIERFTSGFNIGMPRGSLLMINHEHWQPEIGRDVDLIGVRWSISL